jgi:hypothetical protein
MQRDSRHVIAKSLGGWLFWLSLRILVKFDRFGPARARAPRPEPGRTTTSNNQWAFGAVSRHGAGEFEMRHLSLCARTGLVRGGICRLFCALAVACLAVALLRDQAPSRLVARLASR